VSHAVTAAVIAPENGTVSGRDRSLLRVATYNVRDFLDDRAAAARVVRAIDPDVLCLQEVPRRLTTELRLPSFARECGLYWSGGRRGTGGTAILTALRVNVHAVAARRLGVRFPDRTRGYAALDVSLPGTPPLTVVSVHLGLRPEERERHASAIIGRIGPRALVAGDLNEDGDGRAFARLATRYRLVSATRPTYPADHPTRVLDVILAGGDLEVVAGAEPGPALEDVVAASDHRPAWVDVRMGRLSGVLG
jgi:endonuclease/exonuclease/phosphatase family metal-dependent hydrolase